MKIYEKADFIEFCKSKGNESFRGIDMFNCALTQFMRSKNHLVRRSMIKGKNGFPTGDDDFGSSVVGLRITTHEAVLVADSQSFDEVVKALENS